VSGNGYSTNQMPIHREGWDTTDSGVAHDCLFAVVAQGLLLSQGANPFPRDLPDQARNLRLGMIKYQEYSAPTSISENLFIRHFETQSHLMEGPSGDNAQRHLDTAEMRNNLESQLPLNWARTDSRQVVSTQQIFVKCSDDHNRSSTKTLHISRQATAAEVCYEVYKLTGVDMASFNIRFAGKYLEMDTPICHYGIGPDSTIHMHLKGPKGGGRTDNSCAHAAQAEGGYSPEEHGEGDANEVYILVKSIGPPFAEAAEALRQRPRNAATLLLPESDQYLTLSISEGGLGLRPMQKMRLRAELECFLREGAWEAGAPTPGLTPAAPDMPTSTTLSRMIKACPPRTTAVTSRTSQPTSSYITIVGNNATLDITLLSFLEILQMQRVCKEWKEETHTFLTQLKSLSFQKTGALTNFSGKLNIRAIWPSVVRSLSVHLQTIDLRDTEAMGSNKTEAFIHRILESCPNVSSIDMSNCDAADALWAIATLAYKAVFKLQQQRVRDRRVLETSADNSVDDSLLGHWSPAAFLCVLQGETGHNGPDPTEDGPRLSLHNILAICQRQGVPVVRLDPNIAPGSPWPALAAWGDILTEAVRHSPTVLAMLFGLDLGTQSFSATEELRGKPISFEAIQRGSSPIDTLAVIHQAYGDITATDSAEPSVSPILLAAHQGSPEIVRLLVEYRADPYSCRQPDQRGLLALALERGQEKELRIALNLTALPLEAFLTDRLGQHHTSASSGYTWGDMIQALGLACLVPVILEQWISQVNDSDPDLREEPAATGTNLVVGSIGSIVSGILGCNHPDLILVQHLSKIRTMLLRYESFLNQGSRYFEQEGLVEWVTQMMAQEGISPPSSSKSLPKTGERFTLRIALDENTDTILPIVAHDFCYLNSQHIASWGPYGLLVSDVHSGKVMAKMLLPLSQDTQALEDLTLRMAASHTAGDTSTLLATVDGVSSEIILWDTCGYPPGPFSRDTSTFQTASILQHLTGHTSAVTVVAFSKDSNTLVSGSKQDPIRVWKKKYPDKGIYGGPPLSTDGRGAYNDWSHAYSLWGHELPISAITAREDGLLIASGDTGGNIKTWQFYERWVPREGGSYRTGQWLYTSASTAVGPDFSINTLALSPNDTSRLVFSLTSHRKHTTVTCRDRTVGLIEIQRMRKPSGEYCEKHTHRLSTMWGHEYGVTSVDFHPTDANLVASLDRRGILKIWDISTVERPVSLETGYWTPATFKVFRVAIETNEGVVKFSPDGAWITTAFSNLNPDEAFPNHLRSFKTKVHPAPRHNEMISAIQRSENGLAIASISNSNILLWHSTGHCYAILAQIAPSVSEGYEQPLWPKDMGFRVMAFSSCNAFIAGGGKQGHIVLWKLGEDAENMSMKHHPTSFEIWSHERHRVRTLAFSPNKDRLVSGASDWSIAIWDTSTGYPLFYGRANNIPPTATPLDHSPSPCLRHSLFFDDPDTIILSTERTSEDRSGVISERHHWKRKGSGHISTWEKIRTEEFTPTDEQEREAGPGDSLPFQLTHEGTLLRVYRKTLGRTNHSVIPPESGPVAFYWHKFNISSTLLYRSQTGDFTVAMGDESGNIVFLTLRNSSQPPDDFSWHNTIMDSLTLDRREGIDTTELHNRAQFSGDRGALIAHRDGQQFFLKDYQGVTRVLTARPTALVQAIQATIHAHYEGISENLYFLTYGSKVLEADRSLESYDIPIDGLIHMQLRSLGGAPKKNHSESTFLNLFVEASRERLAETEARRKEHELLTSGKEAAMGTANIEARKLMLLQAGAKAGQSRSQKLDQEESRLLQAKEIREELRITMQTVAQLDPGAEHRLLQSANRLWEKLKDRRGGPSSHKQKTFIQWVLTHNIHRDHMGSIRTKSLLCERLMHMGARTEVHAILRSRAENDSGVATGNGCPTNEVIQAFFQAVASKVTVLALPTDHHVKSRNKSLDFQIILGFAAHAFTEWIKKDTIEIQGWHFDLVVEPPLSSRILLSPTFQEDNLAKLTTLVQCVLDTQHQGNTDTRLEHILHQGIDASWTSSLRQHAGCLLAVRLENTRMSFTKGSPSARIKPSLHLLGDSSPHTPPQFYLHIGPPDAQDLARSNEIIKDILTTKVTLKLNMVSDRDTKSTDNCIVFGLKPITKHPATGQEDAIERAKNQLHHEDCLRRDCIDKIGSIVTSIEQDRGDYSTQQGCLTIRSICNDLTIPGRASTSQDLGKAILTVLGEANDLAALGNDLDWQDTAQANYVTVKITGIQNLKTFFSAEKYRNAHATHKDRETTQMHLLKVAMQKRGIQVEALERLFEERQSGPTQDSFLAIFTDTSWQLLQKSMVQMPNSVNWKLKGEAGFKVETFSKREQLIPDLILRPLEDILPEDMQEDDCLLETLSQGNIIFAPKQTKANGNITRLTPMTELTNIPNCKSISVTSVPGIKHPELVMRSLYALLDRDLARLLEGPQNTTFWIYTPYLDALLVLEESILRDLLPGNDTDTNRLLITNSLEKAIKAGILKQATRGIWLEDTPFQNTMKGTGAMDAGKEIFPTRDPVSMPGAILPILSLPPKIGQGLSALTMKVITDLVNSTLLEPIEKQGHTMLLLKASDLKPALLLSDDLRVGSPFSSTLPVPQEHITQAFERLASSHFGPRGWGFIHLSVMDDTEFPNIETNDFKPVMHSEDKFHICNAGSQILAQGNWMLQSQSLRQLKRTKGILQFPWEYPKGLIWLFTGKSTKPTAAMEYRSTEQLFGKGHGVDTLLRNSSFDTTGKLSIALQQHREAAILLTARTVVAYGPVLIPNYVFDATAAGPGIVAKTLPGLSNIHQSWLWPSATDIDVAPTELLLTILMAKDTETKMPQGVIAMQMDDMGILVARNNQFGNANLSEVFKTLKAAFIAPRLKIAIREEDEDYVLDFEPENQDDHMDAEGPAGGASTSK